MSVLSKSFDTGLRISISKMNVKYPIKPISIKSRLERPVIKVTIKHRLLNN